MPLSISNFTAPTWSFALNLSYPIGTSSADYALARARVQQQQTQAQIKQAELQVASDVTTAAAAAKWDRIVRGRPILRQVAGHDGQPLFSDDLLCTYREQFEKDISAVGRRVINATEGGAQDQDQAKALAEATHSTLIEVRGHTAVYFRP